MSSQISLFDPLIVDNFAGGGGASTGIEMATGRPVDIAVNHDQSAILMHQRNHPFTRHYQDDIWILDPVQLTNGRPVHIAWFSPDCKHFSRAKGKALCDRKIRGLAWVAVKWAALVKPDIIMLENVPEFVTWGPLNRGHRPIKAKAGTTFARWKRQLADLGYVIEHRELCAADYGAPTIRKRFVLIARSDGRPIVWPEPTHGPRDSADVIAGKRKAWRAAAEILDFSLPTFSIFQSKREIRERYGVTVVRPLKDNTLKRISTGVDKFVIRNAEPFIVPIGYGENGTQKPRLHDVVNPLPTVVASNKFFLCDPVVAPYVMCNNAANRPHGVDEPTPTVTTGNRNYAVAPILTEYFGNGVPLSVENPLHTVTAKDRECLCSVHVSKFYGGVTGSDATDPLGTVTAVDHNAVTVSHLAHFKGADKGQELNAPLMTITSRDGQFAEIRTTIIKWDGKTELGYWPQVRELLNRFAGYSLGDDEVLLIRIGTAWYFISDIGLRMLTPRELYNAMGFPPDYIIDRDAHGRPISRKDQVARCGNAVCPPLAAAVVRANCPELCPGEIETMKELMKEMTA